MNYGQGAPAFQSLALPGSGGAPFPAGSAGNGLSVNPITGIIEFGSGISNPLDAQLLSDRILAMDMFSWDFFKFGSESIFKLDPMNDEYRLGKLSTGAGVLVQAGAGGGIFLQLNNDTLFSGSTTGTQIGAPGFNYPYFNMGNSGAAQEVATLNFADGGSLKPALRFEYINGTSLFYEIGDLNLIDNGTKMRIDDFNSTITFTANNGIKTVDAGGVFVPGGWFLGQRKVAAVALSATQYLEVSVDGVIYKLGIVV